MCIRYCLPTSFTDMLCAFRLPKMNKMQVLLDRYRHFEGFPIHLLQADGAASGGESERGLLERATEEERS